MLVLLVEGEEWLETVVSRFEHGSSSSSSSLSCCVCFRSCCPCLLPSGTEGGWEGGGGPLCDDVTSGSLVSFLLGCRLSSIANDANAALLLSCLAVLWLGGGANVRRRRRSVASSPPASTATLSRRRTKKLEASRAKAGARQQRPTNPPPPVSNGYGVFFL